MAMDWNAATGKEEEEEPTLRQHLTWFAENTTMHGVARVGTLETRGAARACWLLLVILAAGSTVYSVSRTVISYYTYPVSTTVSIRFEDQIEFPAVTICNLNPMRKSRYEKSAILERLREEMEARYQVYSRDTDRLSKKGNMKNRARVTPTPTPTDTTPNPAAADTTTTTSTATAYNSTDLPNTIETAASNVSDSTETAEDSTTGDYPSTPDAANDTTGDSAATSAGTTDVTSADYVDDDPDPLAGIDWPSDLDDETLDKIRSLLDDLSVEARLEFGHKMSEMMLSCKYQHSRCSRGNFTKFYNQHFGNCYTLNKDIVAAAVSKPGPSHGLKLMLNVESDEYMAQTETVGFKVMVHPHHTMPFPEDEGVVVGPGFSTSIAIMKMDLKRSPPPYGDCRSFSPEENLRLNMYAMPPHQVTYSDKACQRTCYQREVVKMCQCCDEYYPCPSYSPALDPDNDVQYCQTGSACLKHVLRDFDAGVLDCDDECLPACEETTFAEEVSMGAWPSDSSLPEVQHQFAQLPDLLTRRHNFTNPDFFRKNVVKLYLYYKQLNYERIESVPSYNWYTLLSDLGGTLGLMLGFSLLTAVEFLELVFVLLRHALRTVRHTGAHLGKALVGGNGHPV